MESIGQLSYCVNCSQPSSRDCRRNATIYEISTDTENSGHVGVLSVLSSIYKLKYLDYLKFVVDEEDPLMSAKVGVCQDCYDVLVDLFNLYTQFNKLRREDSYLSNTISKLDELMCHLETIVDAHKANKTDIKSELNENTECFGEDDNSSDVSDEVNTTCNYSVPQVEQTPDNHGSSQPGLKNPIVLLSRLRLREQKREDVPVPKTTRSRDKVEISCDYEHVSDDEGSNFGDLESDFEATDDSGEDFDPLLISRPSPIITRKGKNTKEPPTKQPNNSVRKTTELIQDGTCPVCQKKFKVSSNLRVHLASHVQKTDKFKLPCPIISCSRQITTKKALLIHLQRHLPERKHKCPAPKCLSHFYRMEDRRRHLKSHRKDNVFICEKCDALFDSSDLLQTHFSSSHEKVAQKCPACPGEIFETELQLNSHLKTNHPGEKLFICDVCSTCFHNRRLMLRHVDLMHIKEHYKCSLGCGTPFKTEQRLKMHEEICKGQKVYNCSICSKSFRVKAYFNEHKQKHKEDSVGLKCTFEGCDKTFYHAASLARHLQTHSLEPPPFTCDQCGLSVRKASTLKSHMKTHSGEKPSLCSLCGKKFLRESGLQKHMKTHSDLREYPCSACDKVFKYPDSRRLHFRTQHEPGFICPICGSRFPYNFNLKKHLSSVHGNNE